MPRVLTSLVLCLLLTGTKTAWVHDAPTRPLSRQLGAARQESDASATTALHRISDDDLCYEATLHPRYARVAMGLYGLEEGRCRDNGFPREIGEVSLGVPGFTTLQVQIFAPSDSASCAHPRGGSWH